MIAASVALHLLLLALLALRPAASSLRPYNDDAAAVVALVPLYLVQPKPKTHDRQSPPPVHPRQARRAAEETPVAPLYVAPAAGVAASGPGGIGTGARPTSLPPGTQAELGRALRFGGVGCDSPDVVRMTRTERDHCAERFGAGAKTAPYLGQGLSKAKQAEFDAISAHKEAVRKYKEAPMPPGLSTSDAAGGLTGLGDSRPTKAHPF